MALNWNNEYHIAFEGKDLQANTMAVDCTGTFVLLAGRRCIAIQNLDDFEVQKFPRQSKYDVGVAEWNPTFHHKELCVISNNEKLEIVAWRPEKLTSYHTLKAHTRVVTDLNWHHIDSNLLASCSVDTFIHIWDIRDPRRPALCLSAIAEASQVRWNRISSNLLATAHDGDVKIWDQRKGTCPMQYIAAHLAKIHGLDWSYLSETQLATSSQDNTVKFFDTSNPRKAEYVLTTNAPVWRARFTPFGNGLITVVVPQLRRGENSLLLWNTANRATPMHTFVGHKDVVLEFQWRKQRQGESHFQLITWSKDQCLLVWKIEPFLQKLCGYEPEEHQDTGAPQAETVVKAVKKNSLKVDPLQQEFSLLNVHISNIEVKSMNYAERFCSVKGYVNSCMVNLHVVFPPSYPHGVPPVFQIMEDSTVNESISSQLLQTLNHLAQQRVSKNRTCLESCLRQMVTTLEQLVTDSESDRIYDNSLSSATFGNFNDAYIPFPRTSGAKFCSADVLICFGRQPHGKRLSTKVDNMTPRALSALENVLVKQLGEYLSVSAYYYQKPRSRSKHFSSKLSRAIVHVYDASQLFPIMKKLAEKYILDGDVLNICKHNALVASGLDRMDLVQSWKLTELVASMHSLEEDFSNIHPFGIPLIQSLISHYAHQGDIQMAGMLSCVYSKLRDETSIRKSLIKGLPSLGSGSPYHTIPPTDGLADGWVFPTFKTRSSSLDNLKLEDYTKYEQKIPANPLYERYKLTYAETLHRWGLLYNRAAVLKHLCSTPEPHKGVEFLTDCKRCQKPVRYCNCGTCKKLSLKCIICHISVRGSANCCIVCGHGGHTKHLQQWFKENGFCPSGCGCQCLIETARMFA